MAPHVRAIGAVAQFTDLAFAGTSIFKKEVIFGNGSRIIALPANPETARSYEGDVVLDEFAFHQDARKIYEAIEPSISRGYNLTILSTPNGQQGAYYELAKESGLVDGVAKSQRWSAHKTDVFSAIAQGCADRFGVVLDAALLRSGCLDEEMWLQEYCCQFLSIAAQWIPPELFEANVDRTGQASLGDNAGNPDASLSGLFAGWDIARNRDLSVIWVAEQVGDVTWTRGIIEMRDIPTPQQMEIARRLMKQLRRMCIDKSGMGLAMYEQLNYEFGAKVEGVQFTLSAKEALAVHGKRRMEELKTRIPESDMIRNSFRSVKKVVTPTGQSRFDAAYDTTYGHADHWWAFTLAEEAAHQKMVTKWTIYKDAWSDELLYEEGPAVAALRVYGGNQGRYIGVSYGTVRPQVYLEVIDDGETLWVDREYSWDSLETGKRKGDSEYATDLEEFLKLSPDAQVILPMECESFADELRQRGIWFVDADGEDRDGIRDGIRAVSTMMKRRKLRVHRNCVNLVREISTYIWDPDKAAIGIEEPSEENDSHVNALRRVVKSKIYPWRLSMPNIEATAVH